MASGTTNIDDLPNEQPNIILETSEKNTVAQPQTDAKVAELSQEDLKKIISGIQTASQQNLTSLPSRDIPTTQSYLTQDPHIQANYIPGGSSNMQQQHGNHNYIQDEENMERMIEKYQNKEREKRKFDDLYDELQIPIFIAILFFLFQLPFINKTLIRYLPSLFNIEGQMNLIGYISKSLAFGFIYFSLNKIIMYASV